MFEGSDFLAAVRRILEFVGIWTSQDKCLSQTVVPADDSIHYFQFTEHVQVMKIPVVRKTHSTLKDPHVVANYQICLRRKKMH